MSQKSRIVSIGSCYVDINSSRYPFSEGGIASEAELNGEGYELVAGGSAVNFVRTVSRLAVLVPVFVGSVGDDQMGRVLTELLESNGVEARLYRNPSAQTNISFNMTGKDGHHIMLGTGTANQLLDESSVTVLEQSMEGARYLYLGGVYKLKALMGLLERIVHTAREKQVAIVVDHGRIPTDLPEEQKQAIRGLVLSASYYFPSRDELLTLWGGETPEEALSGLRDRAPEMTICMKNGADPVLYVSPSESGEVTPPKVEKIGDVTGAGDMFNGAVLSALAEGRTLRDAIEFGCAAASEKVRA